ncbi:hypothetical protein GY45DRAFT_6837 [Cubamyces sp. BRFM 1775]|nr:hypothetical protein GY45DRAFT_6837 [Cubamyces sp. BRFM 1775]
MKELCMCAPRARGSGGGFSARRSAQRTGSITLAMHGVAPQQGLIHLHPLGVLFWPLQIQARRYRLSVGVPAGLPLSPLAAAACRCCSLPSCTKAVPGSSYGASPHISARQTIRRRSSIGAEHTPCPAPFPVGPFAGARGRFPTAAACRHSNMDGGWPFSGEPPVPGSEWAAWRDCDAVRRGGETQKPRR